MSECDICEEYFDDEEMVAGIGGKWICRRCNCIEQRELVGLV